MLSHDSRGTLQDHFYGELDCDGKEIRNILWPLEVLNARERAVFTEYHYWKTHMKVVAKSHKISLGRTVKSKWIRSNTYTQAINITGVTIYHLSASNGFGNGTLQYTAASKTLTWTAPGGSAGQSVELTKDGKHQVKGADENKFIRVVVDTTLLPLLDKTDTIGITALDGRKMASMLAAKLLGLYRNPTASVEFSIDLNDMAWNGEFLKPTDLVDLTTDETFEKGESSWNKERIFITSVRPDFRAGRAKIEATETKMYRKYGFIAPQTVTVDYDAASAGEREYAFVADINDTLGAGNFEADYTWYQ